MSVAQGIRGTISDHGFQVRYEYCLDVPRCEKCDTQFAVEQLEEGLARDFACVACGDPASTAPAPEWLQKLVPTAKRIYSTDPGLADGGHQEASPLSAPQEAIRPISLSCPQCAGNLQVTVESQRLLPCTFCQSEIYLPDVLWRRLHPVKTVQRFFVTFSGMSRAQKRLAAEKEERRQEKERAAALDRSRAARNAREAARLSRQAESHKERGGEILISAWRMSRVAVALLALLLAWVWGAESMFGIQPAEGSGVTITGVLGAMALIGVVVGVHWISKPIAHAADNGFDWLLFATWFWLPFALLMPIAGTVMALIRAAILYRGKFGASTIESNGSRSHYGAVTLEHGEGRPGALLFLALGTLWPLAVLGLAS